MAPKRNPWVMGCLAVLLAMVVGVTGCVVWVYSADDEGDAVEAWTMCQGFVEDRLVAPATAEYPFDFRPYVEDLGGGRFVVAAYVDAENEFGAQLRSDFRCDVAYQGDGTWELVSLEVE
jgi:hypothetical protein